MRHAILFSVLLLGGCISFGASPPPSLLTLEARTPVPVGQAGGAGATVTIASLSAPASLATPRVPVQATANSVAYVPDAQWTEPPARLFARLLGDTITARTGRPALTNAPALVDPGARLGGELRRFSLDSLTREAVVTFDAQLLRPGAAALETRRFEARVPLGGEIDAALAGATLNDAANRVAAEVADWVGR
jgi:cholesterol transport system auxiliary component